MTMKKFILLAVLFSASIQWVSAQNSILSGGIEDREHIYRRESAMDRKVVPYPPLREADVMWSKRIWRAIDLHEKINAPLRFPLADGSGASSSRDRKNLILTLIDAVKEGSVTAYSAIDDQFTMPLTATEFSKVISGDSVHIESRPDPDNPDYIVMIDSVEPFNSDRVTRYNMKEEWFFDKQRSVMDVRIIGICPVIEVKKEGLEEKLTKPLFWVYFPEGRSALVHSEVGNRYNSSQRLTFDDIFAKRMFNSFITKEENIYDRPIDTYRTTPMDRLLEAEKIKQEMVNFEIGLWDY